MLNNLSFLSLLIRAEKRKKFTKDRFLNMYLNSPDKGTEPPNRAVCYCTHMPNIMSVFALAKEMHPVNSENCYASVSIGNGFLSFIDLF